MAKIAAIEFDENSVRVVVAKTSTGGFQLSDAFVVENESGFSPESADFGSELSKALGSRVGRCESLIAFGRGQSELRVINVPPVPDDELPEIVRNQALRQFANFTEDSPVDFLTLTESSDSKSVLAATIPKGVLNDLVSGCQVAGLQLKGVKMGATCSTALCQSINPDRKNYIILDPSGKTFNLEVVAFGTLCLTRTVRAVADAPAIQMVREIRRTLAAANNQIPDYETSEVVVFGLEADHPGLRDSIQSDLQIDVSFVNPFDHASGSVSASEDVGTYASLIGLLVDSVSKSTETIDFLNPRKKQVSKSGNRVKLLGAIAASVLFLGVGGLAYLMLALQSAKIKAITDEIAQRASNDLIAKEIIGDVGKIEDFDGTQAVWLRELANLSEDFPDPDLAILNQAIFNLDPNNAENGVKIEFNGYVADLDVPALIEKAIRLDPRYISNSTGIVLLTEKEKDQKYYSHKFSGKVTSTTILEHPEITDQELASFQSKRTAVEQDEDSKDEESKDEESKDEESKDEESKDEESKDEESKDEESKDEESKDEESEGELNNEKDVDEKRTVGNLGQDRIPGEGLAKVESGKSLTGADKEVIK